jgi:inosine-uridine nucleoside N-ribohydrolase
MNPESATGAPLWLDVDTGVDDALAIALAVRAGANLAGVSTVAGNVPIDLATDNTRGVLAQVGADHVSVHRGASRPLAVAYHDAAHVHGANGLGGAHIGESRVPESDVNGVQAILDAADRHSGELVLVALGPLTNVAIALSIRPALARQIGRLVIMSGAFHVPGNVTPHAEFNAFADPHAAHQVMATDWPELIAVGLDVTHQTVVSRDQWDQIGEGASETGEMLRQIAARTFTERRMDGFYLHDPLAVAVALDPSLVSTEPMTVDVSLDEARRGMTTPAGSGAVNVATGVDSTRFDRLFAELMGIPARVDVVTAGRSE